MPAGVVGTHSAVTTCRPALTQRLGEAAARKANRTRMVFCESLTDIPRHGDPARWMLALMACMVRKRVASSIGEGVNPKWR